MRKYILIIATVFVIISSTIHAAELFISPSGNDSSGDGTVQSPYKTIQHALNNVAQSGDIITLRSGTYNEEVRIRISNITIRSKSDEWAKISTTPTIDGDNATCTVSFDVGSDGSKLQRVEVTGGFYGIFFFSQWDWDDTPLDNDTATNIVIEDCKIHDTGRDAVKLPAGCDDITIIRCEIYNSGIGYPAGTPDDDKNAEGIDVVNSDRILVQDCYIHDTATTGVYIKGGSLDGIVERTKVENCGGLGIAVGFDTSPEYFDLVANPEYYENIRGIVRNCIVLNTKYAGIALYGSKDAVVYNNTIVNTAKLAHSPIYFGITYQDWDPNAKRPANVNPVIMNNIIMQAEAINSPCVSIRYSGDLGGMSALKGSAVMNNNCYYKTVGSCVFEDSRPDSLLENGTFSQWRIHISGESQSMETNPLTDAGYHLTLGSPCIDKGNNVIPGGISSTDKDNKPRIVNGIVDIGAYEFSGSAISVTPATQVVTKDAGATTFSVSNTGTGTMPWTAAVTSGGGWLSITSGASGTDTGTITCSFTLNTTTSARTETIRVTAPGATGTPVDVTVTQVPTPTVNPVIGSNSIDSMDLVKITDMSGLLPDTGSPVTVRAWDKDGKQLTAAGYALPLSIINHGTTSILGADLKDRFPDGAPAAYTFSVESSKMFITNINNSTDGAVRVPIIYANGLSNFVSNSIGARNTIKVTDMSGTIAVAGIAITVTAWDTSGNAIPESTSAETLKLYSHATTTIAGSSLPARFPSGTPMTYEFTIASPKLIVSNVKNSSDGTLNIPTVYTVGVSNFVSNSIGSRNTLYISEFSGTLGTGGAVIVIKAWDASGKEIPESGSVTSYNIFNYETLKITGVELASRFSAGTPMTYEFTVNSSKVVITNVKSSSDGSINIPTIYTCSGITNYTTNYVSDLNTIRITDMSGSIPTGGASIATTARDVDGKTIPESGSAIALKLNNYGTTTIEGDDLQNRFPGGVPVTYEFSIGSSIAVVTNLTKSSDGTINIPTVFTIGPYGGI